MPEVLHAEIQATAARMFALAEKLSAHGRREHRDVAEQLIRSCRALGFPYVLTYESGSD